MNMKYILKLEAEIDALKAEIDRLKAENAELESKYGGKCCNGGQII